MKSINKQKTNNEEHIYENEEQIYENDLPLLIPVASEPNPLVWAISLFMKSQSTSAGDPSFISWSVGLTKKYQWWLLPVFQNNKKIIFSCRCELGILREVDGAKIEDSFK